MAGKSSEGYDYWAAVDILRHEFEEQAATERRLNDRLIYVRFHGGDVEAAKAAWEKAAEKKSDAYIAYKNAFGEALHSGQPMPCDGECK